MSIILCEKHLAFAFADATGPMCYDTKPKVSGWPARSKVVDFVVNDPKQNVATVWLLEVKDFRTITNRPALANLEDLASTMAAKVTDSLTALANPGAFSSPYSDHAAAGAGANKQVVLHVEPHDTGGTWSLLFPSTYYASLTQKLRQLLVDVDDSALVLSLATTPDAGVPWTVQ